MSSSGDRFACSSAVRFRLLDGEAVLLDLESGTYFGLNGVGARVWQLLEAGSTFDATIDAIEREFDAPRATVERDVGELVAQLAARGLVKRA